MVIQIGAQVVTPCCRGLSFDRSISRQRLQTRIHSTPVHDEEVSMNSMPRRDYLKAICGVGCMLACGMPAYASGDSTMTTVYTDELDGFSIRVPQGWTMGTGSLGDQKMDRFSNAAGMQRVLGWAPNNGDSNISATCSIAVTIKTPGADYTGLGSFGTAQDFGEKLVVSIDRSYMSRAWGRKQDEPIITAKLLSAKETQGRYLIEYETGKTGEPTRHVWTLVCFGENKKGLRRFYTVTASCTDEHLAEWEKDLSSALDSFVP